MNPIEPVQEPRGSSSSHEIDAIVASFGHPVIEPPGKRDCKASIQSKP